MKLVNSKWEHIIELNEGSSTILVIEDSVMLREYATSLIFQVEHDEGPFVLSDEKKEYSLKDRIAVVTDPLQMDIVDKRISAKITSLMKSHMVGEDHYSDTLDIMSHLEAYAEKLQLDFPYELSHNEIDSVSIAKMLGFSIVTEYENELDRMSEYTKLMHDICGIDSFFFIGMSNYFSEKELRVFLHESYLEKHNLVFIEKNDNLDSSLFQKRIIIDGDSCEIF